MSNKAFIKDFSWYFLGSFMPLLIGFIKTPVFTRHFDQEAYGYLGLVTITFSYFGMLLFSWIGSCIWRYYNNYQTKSRLRVLYSNLTFLYVLAITGLLIISTIWYANTDYFLVKQLVFYSFFQLFLNQLFLFYMVILRLKGKAVFYTIFQSIRALFGLLTALILVFKFEANISALVSSLVIIDALSVSFLILFNPAKVKINFSLIRKDSLRELVRYGSAGLIINIGFLIIASSDRYIIAWLSNLDSVGIYDQVYKISQLSVMALITIYFNTINPSLLRELEANFNNSIRLIQKYIKAFILYGLPIIIYLSIFSKDIANIFLGKEFRSGYTIMPLIFAAAYFHGLSNFYELRLKFSNKLMRLSLIVISAAILNIVLNYIFISLYGYKWAALTTTITYIMLIMLFHFFDKQVLSFSRNNTGILIKIGLVLAFQIAIYFILNRAVDLNIIIKIVLVLTFALSYIMLFKKQLSDIEIPL